MSGALLPIDIINSGKLGNLRGNSEKVYRS